MRLGEYNQLIVNRQTDNGLYLIDPNNDEVLLPNRYVTDAIAIGDEIIVFVYKDSEDRLVATTETPKLLLHQFGVLEAKSITGIGAFFDWGLQKDLLVPFREQYSEVEIGKKYIVYLYLDETSDRLAGTTFVTRYLDKETITVEESEEIHALVYGETEIGYQLIVNNLHQGMIFKNEIVNPLQYAEEIVGYVRQIRSDGKLDISLQKIGHESIEPNADMILDYLGKNDGTLYLTDKSSPEDIYECFRISKKLFKKALGSLYKRKLISLQDDKILLL